MVTREILLGFGVLPLAVLSIAWVGELVRDKGSAVAAGSRSMWRTIFQLDSNLRRISAAFILAPLLVAVGRATMTEAVGREVTIRSGVYLTLLALEIWLIGATFVWVRYREGHRVAVSKRMGPTAQITQAEAELLARSLELLAAGLFWVSAFVWRISL